MQNLTQKFKIIIIFAVVILAGFGFAGTASAAYYTSGNWTSTNLLAAETVTSIDSFVYNLSAKPTNTDATIQFSQDNTSWYSSAGVLNGTDTLTTGVNNTINLSGLGWSGANFYYKVVFTSSDGVDTPVLDDISVVFTSNQPPNTPTNSLPTNGATGQDLNVGLTGSAYSDTESDPQTNAGWQMDDDADFLTPVWTRTAGATETTTTITAANGTFANELAGKTELDHNTTYYWQVRYSDGAWSSWSASTTFTTGPNIQFTLTDSSGAESVTPAQLGLSLSNIPSLDVTVDYAVTAGTATGGGVDYTLANGTAIILAGNTTITIDAIIVDDDIDESNETIEVTISNPTNAVLGTNTVHTYTIEDNDTFGLTINPTSGLITTEAGGTATFAVVLNSEPTADVTIGLSSSDTTEGTVVPSSLTFTSANWSVAQTVTATGVDDFVDDGDITYTIITAAASSIDSNYNNLDPDDVSATNTDDDSANFSIVESAGSTAVTEGGATDSFTVVLTAQPSSNVVFDISSNDTTSATVDLATLTFTTVNWNVAQTITVTAPEDVDLVSETPIITIAVNDASSDNNWDPLPDDKVNVTVTDDDVADEITSGGGAFILVPSGGLGVGDVHIGIGETSGGHLIDTQGRNFLAHIYSQINFIIEGYSTPHSAKIIDLDMATGEVTLEIRSEPQIVSLLPKETKIIDLGDGSVEITYNELEINRVDLTFVKTGADVKTGTDQKLSNDSIVKEYVNSKVYLLENSFKRWIVNELSFNYHGFLWSNLIQTNDLSIYPLGKNLSVPTVISKYQFTRSLKLGDTGDDVKKLQEFLNTNGFKLADSGPGSPGNETTFFGSLTRAGVIKFQNAYASDILTPVGLIKGTGFFGQSTIEFVNSFGSNQSAQPTPTPTLSSDTSAIFGYNLEFGMTNGDIRRLQELLATMPDIYPDGRVTGYFGPLTKEAVGKFQLKYNIVDENNSAFGYVGSTTRAKLKEVFGK